MATAGNQFLPSVSPSVDQFAEVLSEAPSWYNLGLYLGAPMVELDAISQAHSGTPGGTLRCLIELYRCLQRKGKSLTWKAIASTLKRMGDYCLADKVHAIIKEQLASIPPHPSTSDQEAVECLEVSSTLAREYEVLSKRFIILLTNVKLAFINATNLNMSTMQDLIKRQCGLPRLPQEVATIDTVFDRVEEECSILNFRLLELLIEELLSSDTSALEQCLEEFKLCVDDFKSSANMVELVSLIKTKWTTPTGDQKIVQLKVREFWKKCTMQQFEMIINTIFKALYNIMTHIRVTEGCICLNWIIPNIDTTELLPVLPLELVRLIGVIYLHIGSDVIYNIEEEGCESIEAAMIQAVELKNTQAIELLLALGCNPEVATYNGNNAVTNIVNIRAIESKESSSSGSSHSVDHICILGHNKHVEAIVDPTSGGNEPEECSSCILKEKMNKHLLQEIDSLYLAIKKKDSELDELQLLRAREKAGKLTGLDQATSMGSTEEVVKMKDAEIAMLKKSFEILKNEKDKEILRLRQYELKSNLPISQQDKSTAVLPCDRRRRVGIKAEMKVKVVTRHNSSGKELATGGSEIRAILTCNEGECPVTDNNDGTYTVSVIPQQLGRHQLNITVNGRYIQGSPYSLDVVPQRDYTKLSNPVQTITGIDYPRNITFSNYGYMFVTSNYDHCIHVYDASGNKKTTIGSGRGTDELQFQSPNGIDINGEVVYVAEYGGHRIHQLTTGGEFIRIFGEEGSAIGQFKNPSDVKISPDGKVYVADTGNNRVQVFNLNWSVSHVIDGALSNNGRFLIMPMSIVFDPLSGHVHVTVWRSSAVRTVFTSSGQYVHHYGESNSVRPSGIAIDPSGYCLVVDYNNGRLSVFDSNGVFIHSVGIFDRPYGVTLSPVDESLWIADAHNCKLLKY